jgi:hypothetical protein
VTDFGSVERLLHTASVQAALGDHRPAFERQWKGLVAALLGASALIYLVKRYRWHRRKATTAPNVSAARIADVTDGAEPR